MFHFENENSFIYKKGFLINQYIVAISAILTMKFDDTIYEPIFRGIWLLTTILWGALMGTKEVVARKNKIGYIYYAGIILLILVIIIAYIVIHTIFK